MKKFMVLLILSVILLACRGVRTVPASSWENIGLDGIMIEVFNRNLNGPQFDSLCRADSITSDLSGWLKIGTYLYEDRDVVVKYLYIKGMPIETTYTLEDKGDMLNVIKRTIKEQ